MKSILVMVGIGVLAVTGFYVGKSYYLKPRVVHGTEAFDISGNLPDGRPFLLSDLRGKYVLIDFWGSWCKPCRAANPRILQMYKDYSRAESTDGSGFEIVSIGIEKYQRNWLSAIAEDGLIWPYHLLCDNLFESSIPKAYNVKQIPTKFLVNPNGIIIAVDPSIDQIMKVLDSKLKPSVSQ